MPPLPVGITGPNESESEDEHRADATHVRPWHVTSLATSAHTQRATESGRKRRRDERENKESDRERRREEKRGEERERGRERERGGGSARHPFSA